MAIRSRKGMDFWLQVLIFLLALAGGFFVIRGVMRGIGGMFGG